VFWFAGPRPVVAHEILPTIAGLSCAGRSFQQEDMPYGQTPDEDIVQTVDPGPGLFRQRFCHFHQITMDCARMDAHQSTAG
jgi:hypothetical protein